MLAAGHVITIDNVTNIGILHDELSPILHYGESVIVEDLAMAVNNWDEYHVWIPEKQCVEVMTYHEYSALKADRKKNISSPIRKTWKDVSQRRVCNC